MSDAANTQKYEDPKRSLRITQRTVAPAEPRQYCSICGSVLFQLYGQPDSAVCEKCDA